MLLSSQIAGLFDHQHLLKYSVNVLDFLHGGTSQIQTYLHLIEVCLVSLGLMARLKVIQNERLNKF